MQQNDDLTSFKPGGGNHLQLYNLKNGEYTDQEKQIMRSYDNFALWSYRQNGENSKFKFHFPTEGIHEEGYCKEFIQCLRDFLIKPEYRESKMNYLLTFHLKNDKSKFLNNIGYYRYNYKELFHDLCKKTLRHTLNFSKFSHGAVLLTAKTILKGKEVTTIWKLEETLSLTIVTLIPGGYKHG